MTSSVSLAAMFLGEMSTTGGSAIRKERESIDVVKPRGEKEEEGLIDEEIPSTLSHSEENRTGSNSVLLTEATEKKTPLLLVNQTSALADRGILSTQPLKCYKYC